VSIPEEGDQVMVGFEYGDPHRPYVTGSLFHGKSGRGGHDQNHLKSISTRSGHHIIFDDDEKGDWSITIKDRGGNAIRLDTRGKNIEISTPETLTVNAKNISLNVLENMNTHIGKNNSLTVGETNAETVQGMKNTTVSGDINVFVSGSLVENIEGDVYSETKQGKTVVNGDQGIDSKVSGTFYREAQKKIRNNGGENSSLF
ncbi:hypothetical protein HQ45_07155, partial [Porphyromonas crevioricanis]|uniref:phage baseplate assembly protein V n=1 Tax=Porphyromonas crevioricanis TaxID=393921 RepID=UPI00052BD00C